MNQVVAEVGQSYIDRLRESKSRSAVVQLEYINLRARIGNCLIFVFEGGDDKIVYSQWFRRCSPMPAYEPFVCNNKEQVLRLHDALMRSLKSMNNDVLFFVDRDFDDLKGRSQSPQIFMTDRYAVENYVVCAEVVDDVLKNEFPCHGLIDLRNDLVVLFERVYEDFLNHLRDFNFHIYVARTQGIELRGHIPDSLTPFVVICPDSLLRVSYDCHELLPYMTTASPHQTKEAGELFDSLDPRRRYRGKFAYKFLIKWLAALVDDYKSDQTRFFNGIDRTKTIRQSEIVLSNLASKSPLPLGLCEFIDSSKVANY